MKYTNIEKPSKEYLQQLISQKKLVKIIVRSYLPNGTAFIGVPVQHLKHPLHHDRIKNPVTVPESLRCCVGKDKNGDRIVVLSVDDISRITKLPKYKKILWQLEHNM